MKKTLLGARARKAAAALGVTAAMFVPLAMFGGTALARTGAAVSEYEHSGSSQYQYKVQLCHRTHSKKHPWRLIKVSSRAVPAHLRHGDQPAPCPTSASAETKNAKHGHGKKHDETTSTSTTSQTQPSDNAANGGGNGHGKGGEHGKGGGHGKP